MTNQPGGQQPPPVKPLDPDKMRKWAGTVDAKQAQTGETVAAMQERIAALEAAATVIHAATARPDQSTLIGQIMALVNDRNPLRDASDLRLQSAAARTAKRALTDQLSLVQANAVLTITAASNDSGKPLYTNETTRNAAVLVALSDNPVYRDLTAQIETVEADIANLDAELENCNAYTRDRAAALRALVAILEYATV